MRNVDNSVEVRAQLHKTSSVWEFSAVVLRILKDFLERYIGSLGWSQFIIGNTTSQGARKDSLERRERLQNTHIYLKMLYAIRPWLINNLVLDALRYDKMKV